MRGAYGVYDNVGIDSTLNQVLNCSLDTCMCLDSTNKDVARIKLFFYFPAQTKT